MQTRCRKQYLNNISVNNLFFTLEKELTIWYQDRLSESSAQSVSIDQKIASQNPIKIS